MTFMDNNFLLENETAQMLFHNYAENEPIFDYHNHLSPKDIAQHRVFHNLYELWLEGDHYKWRAMRANEVEEKYVTGDATPYEKYEAFATIFPNLIGSPVYHWALLELQRYFNITKILNKDTAKEIWDETEKMMSNGSYTSVAILKQRNVRYCCTTDDPIDTLEYHRQIAEDASIPFKVLPSFRPDKYLDVTSPSWKEDCDKLCAKYQTHDLKEALSRSLEFFKKNGCIVSDHGFGKFDYSNETFRYLINHMAKEYKRLNIVMQLHLGPIRNNSYTLLNKVGRDAGGDSIGYTTDPKMLSEFFFSLEKEGYMPKCIVYNLNPSDNEMLATMAGNYAPNVQFGAAWWFNDTYRGMENQIDNLMECNMLAKTVGMLTDSRSFTSFVRHEYYRRILCNKIAKIVEDGKYPRDIEMLGSMVKNICYSNAVKFFNITDERSVQS